MVDARRLVFVDESFCTTSMTREYGWAPVGQRAVGTRPGGRWTTLTLIGAIRLGSCPKLMTHKGSVSGAVFLRFVRERLCPWLRPGDIVLMDNLGAHKVKGVRHAIEAVGAFVVYLPTDSPDFSCGGPTSSGRCASSSLVPSPNWPEWCGGYAPQLPSQSSPPGSATAFPSLNSTVLGVNAAFTVGRCQRQALLLWFQLRPVWGAL